MSYASSDQPNPEPWIRHYTNISLPTISRDNDTLSLTTVYTHSKICTTTLFPNTYQHDSLLFLVRLFIASWYTRGCPSVRVGIRVRACLLSPSRELLLLLLRDDEIAVHVCRSYLVLAYVQAGNPVKEGFLHPRTVIFNF